jgi:hypothetical protein
VRFREDEQLQLDQFPSQYGPVTVTFRTRYENEGYADLVPRELYAEIRGPSPSLDEAVPAFTYSARLLVPFLAVATNAPADELEPHIAFESTKGVSERPFFESHVPDERGLPRQGRPVPPAATLALINSVALHPQSDRLHRSIVHYSTALTHWRPGHEVMCVAHLWMAAEALTPVALREELDRSCLDEDELADAWTLFPDRPERRLRSRSNKLAAEARRRSVLHRDSETYSSTRSASDGLEHSFMAFGKVVDHAQTARTKAAGHVRSAILELSGLDAEHQATVQAVRYATPLDSWRYDRQFRGRLVNADTSDLAAPGEQYPRVRWESSIAGFQKGAEGYDVTFNEKMTAVFAEGVSIAPDSIQIWGPKKDPAIRDDE